ncbi:MAG: tetratricopeptide repeat protein [Candidatus Rokubacteria bacterium]|nr:tetratricopeptide repeat protein [Candidatus Rokubacteria bacterium]
MILRSARRPLVMLVALVAVMSFVSAAEAAQVKSRVVLIAPFDASSLDADERWIGEAVGEVLRLSFVQHQAFIPLERSRLRALGAPTVWGNEVVQQAARSMRADVAIFGRVTRTGSDLVLQPRYLEVKPPGEPVALEEIAVGDGQLFAKLATLPTVYARALRVPLTEAETARIEKAARPTRSLRALELYARAHVALTRGGQDANESAVDLLSRAIESDASFVAAQFALGTVHQALGNRWKAQAQYRAATQLDPTQPEPYKAIGDLFLIQPRRLFDQALEAYAKAIELRPYYADAHVGLGDARAAKGDTDGAIKAYQQALVYNAMSPRVHLSLGKIYFGEKGLYYEAVNAYKKAIDLDSSSVEARMGLGEVYEDKGLWKEAADEYRKVIELDAKHTGAMYNLAIVYEKKDPREAIAQWERYIALASQLPAEKDWVDVARQHLRKLKSQIKD